MTIRTATFNTEPPKGPWIIKATKSAYQVIAPSGSESELGATKRICTISTNIMNQKATAKILASAPTMLELLERVLPTVEHMYHTNPDPDGRLWDDVVAVRSIISELRGVE